MRNDVIIGKLISYSEKVLSYCKGQSYDDFIGDSKLVEACVFNLSQIGELANRLDSEFTATHTEIPWKQLYGLRNRIVHDYDGVNLSLVWEIVNDDLYELLKKLQSIKKL